MEPGRTRQLPDRDHARHPSAFVTPRRGGNREDTRYRRSERHRPVDGQRRARRRRAVAADHRGRVCAQSVGGEGGAGARRARNRRDGGLFPAPCTPSRRSALGTVCGQDCQLRAGLPLLRAAAGPTQLAAGPWRHRAHLARWLHHPLGVPRGDPARLLPCPGTGQPGARRVLAGVVEPGGGVAACGRHRRLARHTGALSRLGAGCADGYRWTACPPTCCRRSGTSSARIPTSVSTVRAGSSSTTDWTGHGGATTSQTYVA